MIIFFVTERDAAFLRELREIEKKWQEKWDRAKAFEANPDPSRPKFYMTVPYPYTSGPLHIGHGRTYTIGDIYARYKRMKGFNVLWPMAFHITGTPIASISARIARGDPEAISLYRSYVRLYVDDEREVEKVIASFVKPENVANFFANVITRDFKSLGYSIDWRRRFTTGDPEYNAFIRWQFLKLREKGFIVQGRHPILYCVNDENAVGEDDIRGGDEFKAEVVEFVGIKFELRDSYLVAATLRPETIFGVTNVWVNPKAIYVKAKVDGETWIISKQAAEKLRYQAHKVEVLEEFEGRRLIGLRCREPARNREVLILPATFVDADNATGVVYSVPAHAPYDYVALEDLKKNEKMCIDYGIEPREVHLIEPISIIRIPGFSDYPARDVVEKLHIMSQEERDKLDEATQEIYKAEFYHGVMKDNCEPFSKLPVREAKEKVKEWLIKKGKATIIYETSPRPIFCRCGGRVIVAVLSDQWFINYGDPRWKELAWKALRKMEIYPEKYRKLFEDTFEWLALRPCARRRGLGTRLPFDERWIIESLSDSTIYMAFYTIIHHIRKAGIKAEQLTPEFFDYVFLGKGDVEEVSRRTGIPRQLLEIMRREFLYWYPLDLRHTAIGHITNHLSFFIFHHVAIFPEELWPKKITLNEYVIREGAKMSKSKGNVLPLVEIPRRYSADLYRLYITYAADLATVVDWREKYVLSVLRRLESFWRLANEIVEYGDVKKPEKLSLPTKWFLSKVNSAIIRCTEHLENFRLRDYVQEAFFNFLSYIETYRRIHANEEERRWAERYALERWVKLLLPVVPHIAEEIWERLGNREFLSLSKWPEPDQELIDMDIEMAVETVFRTIDDVREVVKVMRTKPSKLYIYVGPEEWKYKVCKLVQSLGPTARISDIMRKAMGIPELKKHAEEVSRLVKAIMEGKVPREVASRDVEMKAFKEFKDFIGRELGLEVIVEDATKPSYDPKGRARGAEPGRPGIYLE